MGAPAVIEIALAQAWTFDVDDRLARLFDAHHRRLFLLARRLSGSHDEARDLVQEAFLRAARGGAALPEDAAGELAWLMRTLINLCHDRRRRESVRDRHRTSREHNAPADGPEPGYVARIAVERALSTLDARRRAIVVLHEIEGEPVAWIARSLGVTPVTVRWHLMRARRELARVLG